MLRWIVAVLFGIGLFPPELSAQENKSTAPPVASRAPLPAKAPFDARQARAYQAAWAAHLGTTVELTNSIGAKLAIIPPGEFLMGSSDDDVDSALRAAVEIKADEGNRRRIRDTERPQHRVAIPRPFRLGVAEVTIAQFGKFVDATKYRTEAEQSGTANSSAPLGADSKDKNGFDWRAPGFAQQDTQAVSQVTWNDAVAFCNWLSQQDRLEPCYAQNAKTGWSLIDAANGYRLPTEAEWEYACRAGTTTQFSFGDDYRELEKYGWFNLKSGSTPVRTAGLRRPNPFGLYDMHGNLFEWCEDFFDPKGYEKSRLNIPATKTSDYARVMRGGDWFGNAVRCRSAFRGFGAQVTRSDDVGFRVLRVKIK